MDFPADSILQGDYLERAPIAHLREIAAGAKRAAAATTGYKRACWRQTAQRAAEALEARA